MHRILRGFLVVITLLATARMCFAQQDEKPNPSPPPPTVPEDAVRMVAAQFEAAFNAHDDGKLAALWTADGDYVDELGQRYRGRDVIRQEYATFFAANPWAQIRTVIDSLKIVGGKTAIEDGRAVVDPPPQGAVVASRYTAVYVLDGDRWFLASVHDIASDTAPTAERLGELAFLVGAWQTDGPGKQLQLEFQWIAGKRFLQRMHRVTQAGAVVSEGVQIVGADPLATGIRSWSFSSDGGYSHGAWTPHEGGWAIESTGVTSDGTPTRTVNVLKRIDGDSLSWQAAERSLGNTRLPDQAAIVLRRAPSPQR